MCVFFFNFKDQAWQIHSRRARAKNRRKRRPKLFPIKGDCATQTGETFLIQKLWTILTTKPYEKTYSKTNVSALSHLLDVVFCTCLTLRLTIEHFCVQPQAGSVEKVPLFCLTVKGYFSRGGAASGSACYNAFMEGEERAAQHGWRLHLRIPKRAQLNRTQMDGQSY